jgi:hypothetical protein
VRSVRRTAVDNDHLEGRRQCIGAALAVRSSAGRRRRAAALAAFRSLATFARWFAWMMSAESLPPDDGDMTRAALGLGRVRTRERLPSDRISAMVANQHFARAMSIDQI